MLNVPESWGLLPDGPPMLHRLTRHPVLRSPGRTGRSQRNLHAERPVPVARYGLVDASRGASAVPARPLRHGSRRTRRTSQRLREFCDRKARETVVLDAQRAVGPGAEVLERRLQRQLDDLAFGEVAAERGELLVR